MRWLLSPVSRHGFAAASKGNHELPRHGGGGLNGRMQSGKRQRGKNPWVNSTPSTHLTTCISLHSRLPASWSHGTRSFSEFTNAGTINSPFQGFKPCLRSSALDRKTNHGESLKVKGDMRACARPFPRFNRAFRWENVSPGGSVLFANPASIRKQREAWGLDSFPPASSQGTSESRGKATPPPQEFQVAR